MATFGPVRVVSEVHSPQPAARSDAFANCNGVVQLVLSSGATLRIETSALDSALVYAIVAELRR